MKVLLILTIIAAARAGFLPPNLPFRFTYQNEQQSPLGSSNTNINGGIVSTTAAPIELNNALVSSTPSPLRFQNEFLSNGNAFETIVSSTPQPNIYSSTVNQDSEYVSSTPAPVLPNQNFNSFFVPNIQTNPQFYPGNPQLINIDTNSNNFVQQIPQRLRDYNSVTIESTTSGGSLNDAFGVSEDVIETQTQKPERSIYFFVAPQEPEPIRPKIHFQESKKKVNVVFIKAPAAPSLGTIEITPPEQESPEKTVVYVLVKKPEERQNIIVKQAPAVKPQKPEVVFIKYKDEEEAQEHINKVQAQHDAYIKNQQIGQDILRSGELFNERQSLPIPNPEYIPLINPRFGTTTESTLSAIENEGNEVTQGPLQYNYRFNNVPLAYTTTTVSPLQFNPIAVQQQQQYVPEYISNGAFLQQQVISTSTESPINNGVSEIKPFSNVGFNYVPLTYANQRPQVSINEISNNENIDNFITIGNRQQSSEIFEPTPSPFKRSSSISPRVYSNQSPISASPTARPTLSNYHLFYKKK